MLQAIWKINIKFPVPRAALNDVDVIEGDNTFLIGLNLLDEHKLQFAIVVLSGFSRVLCWEQEVDGDVRLPLWDRQRSAFYTVSYPAGF